jgi:uncharacterized alpha-E superfamily protein
LTGHHLYDIFNTTKKPSEIRKKIYDTILFNKRFPKSLEVSKAIVKEEVADEEEERKKEEEKKRKAIDFNLK